MAAMLIFISYDLQEKTKIMDYNAKDARGRYINPEENHLEALRTGATRYKSKRDCPHHGKVERYTCSKLCVVCARERSRLYAKMDRHGWVTKNYTHHRLDEPVIFEFIRQLNDARRAGK